MAKIDTILTSSQKYSKDFVRDLYQVRETMSVSSDFSFVHIKKEQNISATLQIQRILTSSGGVQSFFC